MLRWRRERRYREFCDFAGRFTSEAFEKQAHRWMETDVLNRLHDIEKTHTSDVVEVVATKTSEGDD